jgi:hypothetical protein
MGKVMTAYAIHFAVESEMRKTGKERDEVFKELVPLLGLDTANKIRTHYYLAKKWIKAGQVDLGTRGEEKKQLILEWVRRQFSQFSQ